MRLQPHTRRNLIQLLVSLIAIGIPAAEVIASREAAILERIAPVGTVVYGQGNASATAAPATVTANATGGTPAASPANRGEARYKTSCMVCHAAGVAGAPKLGVKADWEKRIAQGLDVLVQHAIQGYNAMPARGACMDCSDEEIKMSVDYMLSQLK